MTPEGGFEGFENSVNRIFVVKVDQPGEIEQLTTNADTGPDIYPAWTWARR